MGLSKEDCRKNYRELFKIALSSDIVHSIRNAANFAVPLGNEHFREEIELALGERMGYTKRGRPSKRTRHDHDENNS